MALIFEYEKNLPFTENSLIGYDTNSTLYNYYIDNELEIDKSVVAEMGQYDNINFSDSDSRITLRTVDKIGLKTFPGAGTIAFYKQDHESKNMILRPVHCARKYKMAPTVAVVTNDTTLTFNMGGVKYDCYRIIIVYFNGFTKEYITYTNTLTVPKPNMNEVSEIYCVGYMGEAEEISYDSERANLE